MVDNKKLKNGFTLIEMAIVLTIIGVLVTAIYSGKSLIESSKRQQIISDFGKYEKAYNLFFEKYNTPPGDYKYRILNTDQSDDCASEADGDGEVDHPRPTSEEGYCAFRQLALAGFIDGEFAGNAITDNPKGPYDKTYYVYEYFKLRNSDAGSWGGYWGNANALVLGKTLEQANGADMGFMMPENAYNIDKKMDDGKPLTGKLEAFNGVIDDNPPDQDYVSGKCVNYTSTDDDFYDTTTYNLDSKELGCFLIHFMTTPSLSLDTIS